MVQRLRLAAAAARRRPANLRSIVYGGGPMYVEELKKSLAAFGPVFAQIYGQGEAPMTITSLRRADHALADEAILGSVGWARTGVEVAVVGADGRPLPGEIGEIVCRGDVVMAGYWRTRRPAPRRCATAGCRPATWARSTRAASSACATARRTSSSAAARTSIRARSRRRCWRTPACPRPAWSARRTPNGARSSSPSSCAPGPDVTAAELDAHCLERIARFKRPKRYVFVDGAAEEQLRQGAEARAACAPGRARSGVAAQTAALQRPSRSNARPSAASCSRCASSERAATGCRRCGTSS